MKSFERKYLSYKPILGYDPDINWIRVSTRQELSDNLPSQLKDANSILASDLLTEAMAAKDNLETLISQVEECLSSKKLAGPCQFNEYQKARAESNSEIVAQFDDFHRTSIEGSVQAELYPALLYMHEELTGYVTRLGGIFFGKVKFREDELIKLRDEENKALNIRVIDAMNNPSQIDLDALAIEAKVKSVNKERVEGLQKFIKDSTEAMSSNVNQRFNDKIKDVVTILTEAPSGHLDSIKSMAEVRMGILGSKSQAIHTRLTNVGNNSMRDTLDITINKLRDLHLNKARSLTKWLAKVTDEDSDYSLFELVECSLSSMEEISYNLDNSILDAAKMNKLDELNRRDLINNVLTKKITRQIHRLAGNIQEYIDFDDPNRERQVKRFIENTGLKKISSVCTD